MDILVILVIMFIRRVSCNLKEALPQAPGRAGSSIGRKFARGIVLGGLAGGVIGLAVELSPEEMGLKKKSHELFEQGRDFVDSIVGPVKPLSPPVDNLHQKTEKPKKSEHLVKPSPPKKTVHEVTQPVEPAHQEVPVVQEEASAHETPEEPAAVENPPAAEGEPEPESETTVPVEVSPPPEAAAEGPSEVEFLRSEIARLNAEIESMKAQHGLDMASAAGATQATLDTLDRLYAERETAIGVARHGLVVNELLSSMAMDRSSTSAGALRLDFESHVPALVQACFQGDSKRPSFGRHLLSRLLAYLYCPVAGSALPSIPMASPTWESLAALQVAKAGVKNGDFQTALTHLEAMIPCEATTRWGNKARQSMQLWQGSEAAIASMHEDLSKVI